MAVDDRLHFVLDAAPTMLAYIGAIPDSEDSYCLSTGCVIGEGVKCCGSD
jgi:hypothetical protein